MSTIETGLKRFKSNLLLQLLFALLIIHFMYNLEKVMFITEIFVLVGGYYFVSGDYLRKTTRNSPVVRGLLVYLVYGAVYAAYSFFILKQGSNYAFMRTLPVWYSAFAFFLGVEFVKRLDFFNSDDKTRPWYYLYPIYFFLRGSRWTGHLGMPILLHKTKRFFLVLVGAELIIFALKGGGTGFLIMSMVAFFGLFYKHLEVIKKILLNKFVIFLVLSGFVGALVYLRQYNFADFAYVFGEGDTNMYWRFAFWSYIFETGFLAHPIFGIGFGSELFNIFDPRAEFILNAESDTDILAFVLGTHNSYLYVLVRLGVVGFVTLFFTFFSHLKSLFSVEFLRDEVARGVNIAFLGFLIGAGLNVVLESPVHSGAFWVVFGMAYASVERLKQSRMIETNPSSNRSSE